MIVVAFHEDDQRMLVGWVFRQSCRMPMELLWATFRVMGRLLFDPDGDRIGQTCLCDSDY